MQAAYVVVSPTSGLWLGFISNPFAKSRTMDIPKQYTRTRTHVSREPFAWVWLKNRSPNGTLVDGKVYLNARAQAPTNANQRLALWDLDCAQMETPTNPKKVRWPNYGECASKVSFMMAFFSLSIAGMAVPSSWTRATSRDSRGRWTEPYPPPPPAKKRRKCPRFCWGMKVNRVFCISPCGDSKHSRLGL